jgi:FSR family fosmidomycin resistance protein-like MFS transporter
MATEIVASVAAPPAGSPVRRGFATLALLSVAHFFIDLYSSALSGFQPVLVERLGLSLAQAGVLGGLLVFSSSTLQPIYGYLSDRFHSRLFTALAPAVAGIFISLLGVAPNYLTLIALVLLGGAGIASFHPQGSARATLGITENRGRWMAVFISSGTLGLALGPSFFSWLITGLGIDRTWVGMIPGIAVTGFLLARMPEVAIPAGPRRGFDWEILRSVWKPLTVLYLLVFIRSVVQISFTQFLPLYLTKERALGLNQANLALTLYLGCGAIGGFLGGQLADRFGGRRVILISMIASVPLLGAFFFTTGAISMACLGLGGLILLFTIPVNVTMGQDLAPSQAGTVSALMMGFAWGTAGMLFIPLVGFVADQVSLHWSLFSLLAFPIAGFFLALKLPRTHG